MSNDENLYYCDPFKNTDCTKESCYIHGGDCRRTTNSEYSAEPVMDMSHAEVFTNAANALDPLDENLRIKRVPDPTKALGYTMVSTMEEN